MTKFDEVVDELGDTEIDEKTFATIMLSAVTPTSLQEKIKDRMLTARPPDGDDDNKAKWRKQAKKNSNLMYDLIRENAQYEDKQRIMQAKTASIPNQSNEICRNYKRGTCKLGDKCPRKHITPNNTKTETNATPSNNSSPNQNNKSEIEEDTRNDCWYWVSGQKCPKGDKCFFRHDQDKKGSDPQVWDKLPPKQEKNGKGNTTGNKKSNTEHGGGNHGGGKQITEIRDEQPSNSEATASKICVVCGDAHDFFTCCPKRGKVCDTLLSASIGYSHTARWWQNAKNIEKFKSWHKNNPKAFSVQQQTQERYLRYCGTYNAFGRNYSTDIDLGGDVNIAPEQDYEKILKASQAGKLKGWRVTPINKTETVQLANGDMVQISKWLSCKLTGESVNARQVTAYDTEFGFAQAWPDKLIIGRHTAEHFGYKDPQKQRLDARTGPTPSLTKESQDIQNSKQNPNPVPNIDPTEHKTEPMQHRTNQQNITAVGTAYLGHHSYKHTEASLWTYGPMLKYSYITSAALTRSAQPRNTQRTKNTKTHTSCPIHAADGRPITETTDLPTWARKSDHSNKHISIRSNTGITSTFATEKASKCVNEIYQPQHLDLLRWIQGQNDTSNEEKQTHTTVATIPATRILQRRKQMIMLDNQLYIVIPSNECKVIIGREAMKRVRVKQDTDPSPLRHAETAQQQQEVEQCLHAMLDEVDIYIPEISIRQKQRLSGVVNRAKKKVWRSKYAISDPAIAYPMQIKLKPGAVPPSGGLPRRNFTPRQHEFLGTHLKHLVDMKIISKHEGPWACPIVLVLKPDQTWRLCVDPTYLNANTETLLWDMPEPAKDVQMKFTGSKYFATMDLIKSFWQFELHDDSKNLFTFYAHPYGQFRFERVAMGAKNSSAYVQKTMTNILRNANLIGHGVEVTTDDIIVHAATIDELISLLEQTLHTLDEHNLHVYPGKVKLMRKSVLFNGLLITGEGIKVDPNRIRGLTEMPLPRTVGDVYQFYCAAGWLRSHVPRIAELIRPLQQFVTSVFQTRKTKKRTMRAADRIPLSSTQWTNENNKQFEKLQRAIITCITKAYRDPKKQVCIFTDASNTAWSYIITQCDEHELDKVWDEQQHEILAVNSGVFKNNQVGWDMCCKEAYPIKECFERHRSLLHGNLPVVSVNDHKNLLYISVDAYRHSTVTQAARHRLARWALFMAEENIRVVHIPGTQNHLADLLSRNGNKEYAAAKRNEQQVNTKSTTPS